MDKYLVVGNPIAHSKSPEIHQQFADQTGQKLNYDKLLLEESDFDQAVKSFASVGGKGMNVTVPFKEKAFALADNLSERAQLAEAVNTLIMNDDGTITGDNTDGAGLVFDISTRLEWVIKNKRILVLGAGGAVKGVLLPLLKEGPQSITIANRTVSKAEALAERFSAYGNIEASSFMALEKQAAFDLIINATSAGLSGEMPILPDNIIGTGTAVYDMVYAKEDTACMRWARQLGCQHIADGLGMLVGQAAESFRLWRGQMPDVAPVFEAMKAES
ncbi:shikimate dehydrogenase [Agaribacterium sp. ZY112]|uniref:shikimate dehydrogenase n=1 Tax=Agaribacterium sp. ZY112 TaxID=3233574 RepID=UPI003523447E